MNENGELVLLMRNKKESKSPNFYLDFGTTMKEYDLNILYSVVRSYISKTAGGLCLASELVSLSSGSQIERKIKESNTKLH